MIIGLAVLAILLLISIVVNLHLFKNWKASIKTVQHYVKVWMYEKEGHEKYRKIARELDEKIAELKASNSQELKPQVDETQGSFVRTRSMKRATPETYRNVFDLDVNGQRVLDDLELVFSSKSTYVRGGHDAERESCFRAGQTSVVGHIFKQINKANDPNYKEEVNE